MLRHLHLLQPILPNRRNENAATKNSSDFTSLPKVTVVKCPVGLGIVLLADAYLVRGVMSC
jgi:hypothetical protein